MRACTGHADHCCYFKKLDISYLILLLYVDDMLVADSSMEEISNLKAKLSKDFAKDWGAAKQILGMRISRDRVNRKLKLYRAVLSAVDEGVWAAV